MSILDTIGRKIGSELSSALLRKPDGSAFNAAKAATMIGLGVASRTTGQTAAKAADMLAGGKSKVKADANSIKSSKNLPNLILNPLENFASYIPVWTFACLTKDQFNSPASYRNSPKDLKNIVFSSAGRFNDARAQTAYGAPEYFVNNFVMQTTIAANQKSGNSNAFKFTWDIIEPQSMGLLLQSMQVAAKKAGFLSYMNKAPFVLRLDFVGYDQDGTIIKTLKPKFWTVSLTKVTFSVNEQGSVYKCEAVPMNHKGFADTINTLYSDITISCSAGSADTAGTVKDLLTTGKNSLCAYLNSNEQSLLDAKRIGVKDVYEIQFPEKSDEFINNAVIPGVTKKATADPKSPDKVVLSGTNVTVSSEFGENTIGKSKFGFTQKSGGNIKFSNIGDTVDPKTGLVQRDKMVIDPKNRSFQFTQGQNLVQIINQVILSSEYSKSALDPNNMINGMIKWWRLDVQVMLLDLDDRTGDYAQKIIFRVVPFLIHHSIFAPPTTTPIGYNKLQEQVVKEYNYIYTGQNLDVLKFDIQIDNLFFTGGNTSTENKSAKVSNQDQKGMGETLPKDVTTTKGTQPEAQQSNIGRARVFADPKSMKKAVGGSGESSTEQEVAAQFHKVFLDSGSGDLVKVNLETMGDTYWLVDSGLSNYFSRQSAKSMLLTEDGTANYESGDVYVYLTFRTPSDVNTLTGLYEWPSKGKESPFSGIYRVTQCENTFTDGIFKQKLTCIRQVGQSQDYTDNPNVRANAAADKVNLIAQQVGIENKPKTDPSQESTSSNQRVIARAAFTGANVTAPTGNQQ